MRSEPQSEARYDRPEAQLGLRLLARLIARAHRAKVGLDIQGLCDQKPAEQADLQPEGSAPPQSKRGKRHD